MSNDTTPMNAANKTLMEILTTDYSDLWEQAVRAAMVSRMADWQGSVVELAPRFPPIVDLTLFSRTDLAFALLLVDLSVGPAIDSRAAYRLCYCFLRRISKMRHSRTSAAGNGFIWSIVDVLRAKHPYAYRAAVKSYGLARKFNNERR